MISSIQFVELQIILLQRLLDLVWDSVHQATLLKLMFGALVSSCIWCLLEKLLFRLLLLKKHIKKFQKLNFNFLNHLEINRQKICLKKYLWLIRVRDIPSHKYYLILLWIQSVEYLNNCQIFLYIRFQNLGYFKNTLSNLLKNPRRIYQLQLLEVL